MHQITTKMYEIIHDWVGKVIQWELCKNWPNEEVLYGQSKNEAHKFLWDFEMQVSKSKAADRNQGRPEGSLFHSYYTKV